MTMEEAEYFRRRERQERAAAKQAGTLSARRAHQQLADNHSVLLYGIPSFDPVAPPANRRRDLGLRPAFTSGLLESRFRR